MTSLTEMSSPGIDADNLLRKKKKNKQLGRAFETKANKQTDQTNGAYSFTDIPSFPYKYT